MCAACPTYCALCYIIIHNILFVILLYISKPWLFELQKQMNLFFLLLKKKFNTVIWILSATFKCWTASITWSPTQSPRLCVVSALRVKVVNLLHCVWGDLLPWPEECECCKIIYQWLFLAGRWYLSTCGGPLQSSGCDSYLAGSILLCVREEFGELWTDWGIFLVKATWWKINWNFFPVMWKKSRLNYRTVFLVALSIHYNQVLVFLIVGVLFVIS